MRTLLENTSHPGNNNFIKDVLLRVIINHILFLYKEFKNETDKKARKQVLKQMFLLSLINILFGNQNYDFNKVIKMFYYKKKVNFGEIPLKRMDQDEIVNQLSRWIQMYCLYEDVVQEKSVLQYLSGNQINIALQMCYENHWPRLGVLIAGYNSGQKLSPSDIIRETKDLIATNHASFHPHYFKFFDIIKILSGDFSGCLSLPWIR